MQEDLFIRGCLRAVGHDGAGACAEEGGEEDLGLTGTCRQGEVQRHADFARKLDSAIGDDAEGGLAVGDGGVDVAFVPAIFEGGRKTR